MPRIAAILVVNNGLEWLPTALGAIVEQQYPALDLIVVDNASSDGSAELLARRIPADRLVTMGHNVGFGRAVAEALKHEAVERADLVLLLHDDVALGPDAIERLVEALEADSSLTIVGPKLREWSEDPILQEVGMTIDRFGRAETLLEPGELDQGQRDRQREVLYVSTAGMLLRSDALRALGGFDLRFPAMRDDLDLCWRAWLAGHRVEIVPDAVAYHAAGTARMARRIGKGRSWEPRYLAERHTLAALLKNYGPARLAVTLPFVLALALLKTLAFVATRRFGEAVAVLRAYAWNAIQLPRTLRRRRVVQARRAVPDRAVMRLFAPGLPRVRSYTEALFNWLAGGSSRALAEETEPTLGPPAADESGAQALLRSVRTHPTAYASAILGAAYLIGIIPLLGPGQITGGDIAAWPQSASAFLTAYANPWSVEPAASGFFSSPVIALIGALSYLAAGSVWAAQRLLVLGLVPLAWFFALRAGHLITSRPAPRVLGATLYALSPAVLAPLANGRYGELIAAALLPAVVLGAANATVTDRPSGSAWRAAALLGLGMAMITGAAAELGALLWIAYAIVLAVLIARRDIGRPPVIRLAVAGAGAVAIVGPWLFGVVRTGTAAAVIGGHSEPSATAALPLISALLAAPGLPGVTGVSAALLPAAAAAAAAAALLLGMSTRPRAVAWLAGIAAACGLTVWALGITGADWPSGPALLIPAALAYGGLGVIAARCLVLGLRTHSFGVRQVAVVLVGLVLTAGVVAGALRVASGPWERLSRGAELLPAFVVADEPDVGPYRIVLVSGDLNEVRWDLTASRGPSMEQFGAVESRELLDSVSQAVAAAAGAADVRGGGQLGLVNVRYLVLADAEPSQQLRAALLRQPSLEPLPSHDGRVFRVRSWMPRAAIVPRALADSLLERGERPEALSGEHMLRRVRGGLYRGGVAPDEQGLLVVSEEASPLWQARVNPGGRLERVPLGPINAFSIGDRAGSVEVRARSAAHRLIVGAQIVVVLALVSLVLRPPGITQRRQERIIARGLPSGVASGTSSGQAADGAAAPADHLERPGSEAGGEDGSSGEATPEVLR
ncbi:MAG TPA: glycosyltransferase family 2 protein [Egibacteraceae bacterium]|nr:glycosyltransferase family 2 protein [Egibacteraceae bacterium]